MGAVNHQIEMARYVPGLIIVLTLVISSGAHSQNIYWSKNGTVSITAPYAAGVITGHSKEVEVTLDYSTATFTLALPLRSIHTEIDSVNTILNASQEGKVVLKGVVNSGIINVTPHLPQRLLFTGMLQLAGGSVVPVKGTSRLEHIGGGEDLACKLALSFDVDIQSLGLPNRLRTVGSSVASVYFDETILRRGK